MNTSSRRGYYQDVFVEQSAFIAFMDPTHPHYHRARSFFMDLDDLERHMVTTNYVVFDTHEWLRNEHHYKQAEYFLDVIEQSVAQEKLTIIPGSSELEQQAKSFLSKHSHYEFSLGEAATSVALLHYNIERIFTFNPVYRSLQNLNPDLKIIPSF